MIYRKNNIFDKVRNDYDIPVESVAEVCEMDIGRIKKNVFDEIGVKSKKVYHKKRVFIMIAAAVTVCVASVIVVNGSKPVPREIHQLESDEYFEWTEKNSKIPRVLNVPMPSDEEKAVIDKIQDEYVDIYKTALQKYSAAFDKHEAQFKAEEDVVKSLFERTMSIFKKYGYDTFDENDDIMQIINICCNAAENQKMTLEEKIILKFFLKQVSDIDDEYIREKIDLTFIPVIDIYTGYSYEKDKYYIHDELTGDEKSQ